MLVVMVMGESSAGGESLWSAAPDVQRGADYDVWQTSLHNPSFAEYAKLCGALGLRVTAADELEDALAEALAHEGPATVQILADPLLV